MTDELVLQAKKQYRYRDIFGPYWLAPLVFSFKNQAHVQNIDRNMDTKKFHYSVFCKESKSGGEKSKFLDPGGEN